MDSLKERFGNSHYHRIDLKLKNMEKNIAKYWINKAYKEKWALGMFNAHHLESFQAISEAANKTLNIKLFSGLYHISKFNFLSSGKLSSFDFNLKCSVKYSLLLTLIFSFPTKVTTCSLILPERGLICLLALKIL